MCICFVNIALKSTLQVKLSKHTRLYVELTSVLYLYSDVKRLIYRQFFLFFIFIIVIGNTFHTYINFKVCLQTMNVPWLL